MDDRLYIVTYDIADQKRWRAVFKLLRGHGEWLQLSVFQCRLGRWRHAELVSTLDQIIHHDHDHILIMDIGPADAVDPKIVSLGKDFKPVVREPIIV